jgi:putative oxidoreductase
MFWAVLLARIVLGLPFLVFGLDHFLHFLTMPQPTMPENAMKFVGALASSGYLNVIKVLEVAGGVLVLSGRLVPLGLTLLTPVAVNILLFEIFLVGTAGPGLALTVLCALLVWAYRSHFAPVFALRPRIG